MSRKKRKRASEPAPAFDPRLRYSIELGTRFLAQSRATTYKQIRAGDLKVIREGKRVYIPGAEIERRCSAGAA